jgi:hypothetical protein
MKWDTATISVIISGAVAMVSTLAPILVSLINEWIRQAKEGRSARLSRIDSATAELLTALAHFRGECMASPGYAIQDYANILAKYYVWEQIVWTYCGQSDRDRLADLRRSFEEITPEVASAVTPPLAEVVLQIARKASENAK